MPLVPNKLKKDMEDILKAAFAREFKDEIGINDTATKSHEKMAKAISDIAIVIVQALTSEAQVAIGIPTAGSPSSHTSVGPGKIT